MTYLFLELLRKYVSVYVLLSRIEERRAVAALYATAHEIIKGGGFEAPPITPACPNIAQRATLPPAGADADGLRVANEEVCGGLSAVQCGLPALAVPGSASQMIASTMANIHPLFMIKYSNAENLRKTNGFSIVTQPQQV